MVQPCLAPLQRKRLQRRARFNRVFDPARSSLVSPAEEARKAAQRKRDMGSFATVGTLQDALQSALKEAPVPTGSIKSIASLMHCSNGVSPPFVVALTTTVKPVIILQLQSREPLADLPGLARAVWAPQATQGESTSLHVKVVNLQPLWHTQRSSQTRSRRCRSIWQSPQPCHREQLQLVVMPQELAVGHRGNKEAQEVAQEVEQEEQRAVNKHHLAR